MKNHLSLDQISKLKDNGLWPLPKGSTVLPVREANAEDVNRLIEKVNSSFQRDKRRSRVKTKTTG